MGQSPLNSENSGSSRSSFAIHHTLFYNKGPSRLSLVSNV